MQVSARVRGVVGGADDGWGIYYRARAMQAAGQPVVMLTIGDHDIKMDPAIQAALTASMAAGNLGYAPISGSAALRGAIARRAGATPDQVIVTAGGQAALYAAMMAVLDPGCACIVLHPYYATYEQTVRAASGRPILVATRAEDGFQPDAAVIEAALTPDTRAILINTPNNPTGAVYTPERLAALAELCQRRDLWLISDEVYATQVWQGAHLSPRDLPGMADRCLVVQSLSKSHGMTGARLGWVLGPEAAIARLGDLAIATNYGIPGFVQDAGLWALEQGAAIEADITARYARRRRLALDALGNGPGFRVVPPQGAMYVMLDIRATGLSGKAFAEALLAREGIAVMPGESFGAAAAGHLRVALTVADDVLAEALGRLAGFAAAQV